MYRKIRYEVRWRVYNAMECQWYWQEQQFAKLKECKAFIEMLYKSENVNRIIKHRVEIVKGLAAFEG